MKSNMHQTGSVSPSHLLLRNSCLLIYFFSAVIKVCMKHYFDDTSLEVLKHTRSMEQVLMEACFSVAKNSKKNYRKKTSFPRSVNHNESSPVDA